MMVSYNNFELGQFTLLVGILLNEESRELHSTKHMHDV
jgi:hypothetical protein